MALYITTEDVADVLRGQSPTPAEFCERLARRMGVPIQNIQAWLQSRLGNNALSSKGGSVHQDGNDLVVTFPDGHRQLFMVENAMLV